VHISSFLHPMFLLRFATFAIGIVCLIRLILMRLELSSVDDDLIHSEDACVDSDPGMLHSYLNANLPNAKQLLLNAWIRAVVALGVAYLIMDQEQIPPFIEIPVLLAVIGFTAYELRNGRSAVDLVSKERPTDI
jgi:hypothetical protein